MLQEIAKVLNLSPAQVEIQKSNLDRIAAAISQQARYSRIFPSLDNIPFRNFVRKAYEYVQDHPEPPLVSDQEKRDIRESFKVVTTRKPTKPSGPKGKRSRIPSPDGIRYGFGPVWNKLVQSKTGDILHKSNRKKLEHHARVLGLTNPEDHTSLELCDYIIPRIGNER